MRTDTFDSIDLKEKESSPPQTRPEAKEDEQGRIYATGKRKSSIARVWIKAGSGKIEINGKDGQAYFPQPSFRERLRRPFHVTNSESQFDIKCTVRGGGLSGQSDAVKFGISKALALFSASFRPELKAQKLISRDAREVERKHYGRRKARRGFQFSKR